MRTTFKFVCFLLVAGSAFAMGPKKEGSKKVSSQMKLPYDCGSKILSYFLEHNKLFFDQTICSKLFLKRRFIGLYPLRLTILGVPVVIHSRVVTTAIVNGKNVYGIECKLVIVDGDLDDNTLALILEQLRPFLSQAELRLVSLEINTFGSLLTLAGLREIVDNLDQVRELKVSLSGLACFSIHHDLTSYVARLKNLRALELVNVPIDDAGCNYLASLKNLESLRFSGSSRLTDKGMRAIATLKHLKHLAISKCNHVTGKGFEKLAGLKKLEVLSFSDCLHLQERDILRLRCKRLKSISLFLCSRIAENCAKTISLRFPELQEICFSDQVYGRQAPKEDRCMQVGTGKTARKVAIRFKPYYFRFG